MLPRTSVCFQTEDTRLQQLYDAAEEKCLRNLKRFGNDLVLVEGGGYEKIWLETQPMGGEMYAAWNLEAALNNQLLFMRTQREDGRLPGSIQCFPDGHIEAQFNKLQGFCFPWHALNMYYLIGRDKDYLRALRSCLESFDRYLWKTRNVSGTGCLSSFCVYDTGEDNAVRYGDAPVYCADDTPPQGSSVVPMISMDITSFSYSARDTLRAISVILGDGKEQLWQAKAQEVADALKKTLWDDRRGACFDRDKYGYVLPQLLHNNLRCMYWGAFSQEMADRFVREHLLREDEFWTALPLPSVAANDPDFRNAPENNWSGQCEGLTFQRAILALERYGYEKVVTHLGLKLLDAVMRGGNRFTQQYDPFTGAPSCVGLISHQPVSPNSTEPIQDAYGPTLLAVLETITHLWGVDVQMGQVWFSLCSGAPSSFERRQGEHVYGIKSDGSTARVYVDGKLRYQEKCGVRLITDEQGQLLGRRLLEEDIR